MRYLRPWAHFFGAIVLVWAIPFQVCSSTSGYRLYENDRYGFSLNIPEHWVSEINDYSLVFSGAKGSEEWNTTINVQILEKGDYTLASLAQALYNQWQGNDMFLENSREEGRYGGGQGIRYQVTYQRKNDTVIFDQDQLVIEGSDYFYLLGYTAPQFLYREHYDKMVKAVNSFEIAGLSQKENKPAERDLDAAKTNIQNFIESVQLFREVSLSDGNRGWDIFATDKVKMQVERINQGLWNSSDPVEGWAYYLALCSTTINRLETLTPLVGFYHPWSDTWLLTEWSLVPDPKIINAQMVLGDWVRRKGDTPLQVTPQFRRASGLPSGNVVMMLVESFRSLDEASLPAKDWRTELNLINNRDIFDEINTPAVTANVMGAWLNVMDYFDLSGQDNHTKKRLHKEVEDFFTTGANGSIGDLLAFSATPGPTAAVLASLPPDEFETFTPVFWLSDKNYTGVFLIQGNNPDNLLSLLYRKTSNGLILERADFTDLLQAVGARK